MWRVCKFTSFIMFVSRTISLSIFQKSSGSYSMFIYMFTPQNPVNFSPVTRIHHPAGCFGQFQPCPWAGASVEWALSARSSMAPAKLPLYYTETATNTTTHAHMHTRTHTHIHTYTHTHRENKTKQRCTTLTEKYWTNLRHYLI